MKIMPGEIPTLEIMLLERHMRIQEVADAFRVTRGRIWQICKQYGIVIHRPIKKICLHCETEFEVGRSRARKGVYYCSDRCYYAHKAEISDYQPHRQGQRIARKKIETWLGFPLPEGCIIHHEDGDQLNNKPDNTFVFPSHSAHLKYHHAKRHDKAILPYTKLHELPDKLMEWFPSSH